MTTWSLTSSSGVVAATSGQLIKARLAMQSTCPAVATPAAWPLVIPTGGDINPGAYPYFDVPAGWPTPVLPGP